MWRVIPVCECYACKGEDCCIAGLPNFAGEHEVSQTGGYTTSDSIEEGTSKTRDGAYVPAEQISLQES